jgi:hypothetical protein
VECVWRFGAIDDIIENMVIGLSSYIEDIVKVYLLGG